MRRPTLAGLFVCSFVAALLSACGGGGSAAVQVPAPAPTLQSVSVTPANLSLVMGMSRQFVATGSYSNGTTQDLTATAVWSSSAMTNANITPAGLVKAARPGTSTITANAAGIFGTATLSVTPPVMVNALAWSGSRFAAVGNTMSSSTDGMTWTSALSPIDDLSGQKFALASFSGIQWDGTQFLAVGYKEGVLPCVPDQACLIVNSAFNSVIFRSPDGLAWTAAASTGQATVAGSGLNGIVSAAGKSVAVGADGLILSSTDGRTWITQSSGTTETLIAVSWSGSRFVAVGNKGTVVASADGAAWTRQVSGTDAVLNAITWAGNRFVAVGLNGTVITSPDGAVWTRQQSNTAQGLYGVAWSGKHIVVVGTNDTIVSSTDGITWSARSSGTKLSVTSIIWAGQQFVAGGVSTILTSVDGVSWTIRN